MTNAAQEEALRQLQMQHNAAIRSLGIVKAQGDAKERQRRIAELSLGEIESACLEQEPEMWTGVGKMFIRTNAKEAKADLRKDLKSSTEDVDALRKKAKYLETEIAGAERNLREIIHGQRRAD